MANDEHVAILKNGVAAWNAWRDENANIRPDLSEADLSGADLSGANLKGADLDRANLVGADLSETDWVGQIAVLSPKTLRDALINAVSKGLLTFGEANEIASIIGASLYNRRDLR